MRYGIKDLQTLSIILLYLGAPDSFAGQKIVFFAGGLKPDELTTLTANVAAADEEAIVLLDSPESRRYSQSFLDSYKPSALYLVGSFVGGTETLERDLKVKVTASFPWKSGIPEELWKLLFPRVERVVVCAAEPRRLFLQAACLAGAMKAPLLVLKAKEEKNPYLTKCLTSWGNKEIVAVGQTAQNACQGLVKGEVQSLPNETAVVSLHLKVLRKKGTIRALVLANPSDTGPDGGTMSSLAPWVAIRGQGALLFTNDVGKDGGVVIRKALATDELNAVEYLTIVADLKAIPPERRDNPLEGKDEYIELEPPGPREGEAFTLATGRLYFPDPSVVLQMLARQRLLADANGSRKALIVSNHAGDLPLMETISRNTVRELKNAGYTTNAFFHKETSKDETRRLLPEADLFLWEGHRATLTKTYQAGTWEEPMRPSFVFLQSCLALSETEAHPFLRRGAFGVVGSSSRTYSASGGAFSLAYLDAVMYDDQTLGGALRQAKNFLLAFSALKKQRLGEAATRNGATLRSAWAFTLWGDPTIKLPHPKPPEKPLPTVRAHVEGQRITLTAPEESYEGVQVEKYQAKTLPNGRLGGYLTKADEDTKRLSTLLFAEVRLKKPQGKKQPILRSKLLHTRWVFLWDERRSTGYLLVLPQTNGPKETVFDFRWQDNSLRGED